MKNLTEKTKPQDYLPTTMKLQDGWREGFDLLTTTNGFQWTVIGTFADEKRAMEAGEKIAAAFGAEWLGMVRS